MYVYLYIFKPKCFSIICFCLKKRAPKSFVYALYLYIGVN